MSKHRKYHWRQESRSSKRTQQAVLGQPQGRTAGAVHIIRPALSMGMPSGVIARYRVTVLLRSVWYELYQALKAKDTSMDEPKELGMLDTLVEEAAPALALQALYTYLAENMHVYRQGGIDFLSFQPLSSQQQNDTTVWGELCAKDIIPELQDAITLAAQARMVLPDLPHALFWPVMGAFFSAVDAGPNVSARTWREIAAHPGRYTLIAVFVTAQYGEAPALPALSDLCQTRSGSSDWRLCLHCRRTYQAGEGLFIDNRWLCPYRCNGEINRDTWDWEYARVVNPDHPLVPTKWQIYPLFSENEERSPANDDRLPIADSQN